ncbi:hypothetical protein LKO27_01345 [Tessaracoccus sp. OS52]|uniref:CG0192-related protein n=1 Tax=Tessaracoccus sp. OS52 TaxID=2886691 RepID=UPI001D111844|nr:hypothetical protein [Tessaracoccus sp. OS52]MCC2592074.1 hypothetical protein [Tessaracoccus sp. OS52]
MTRRAEVHQGATLTPTKLELLTAWLPSQVWFTGDATAIEQEGRFRFVDPDGEVGIETILARSGDDLLQVPLTYRAAPLEDADDALVGTLEHSELGTRYVYDAMSDPVYLAELERVIRERDTAAEIVSLRDGSVAPPGLDVRGTGVAQDAAADGELEVIGVLTDATYEDAAGRLIARLGEGDDTHEVVLAVLR